MKIDGGLVVLTTKTEPLEGPKAREDSDLDAQKGSRSRRVAPLGWDCQLGTVGCHPRPRYS